LGFTSSSGQLRCFAAYSLVPPSPTADKMDLQRARQGAAERWMQMREWAGAHGVCSARLRYSACRARQQVCARGQHKESASQNALEHAAAARAQHRHVRVARRGGLAHQRAHQRGGGALDDSRLDAANLRRRQRGQQCRRECAQATIMCVRMRRCAWCGATRARATVRGARFGRAAARAAALMMPARATLPRRNVVSLTATSRAHPRVRSAHTLPDARAHPSRQSVLGRDAQQRLRAAARRVRLLALPLLRL
jgi:hypothetical protein